MAIAALVLLPVVVVIGVFTIGRDGDGGPEWLPLPVEVDRQPAVTGEQSGFVPVTYEPDFEEPEASGPGRAYRLPSTTDADRVAEAAAALRSDPGTRCPTGSVPRCATTTAPSSACRRRPDCRGGTRPAALPENADDRPSRPEARSVALDVLSAMGVDTTDAEVTGDRPGHHVAGHG